MRLRDYQQQACDCVFKEWETVRSTLVVIPTGGGKTQCFAEIVRRSLPKRAIVIAHREELIFQAKKRIEQIAGIECDVEMAEMSAMTTGMFQAQCVIATVQTMSKRCIRFNPMDYDLVIVDECHHSTAKSWVKVLDHFKKNPKCKILGVTATPDRADEEALGKIFDTVAFDYEILEAISDGWLVPVEQQMVHVAGLDFSHISTVAGDLNDGELASVMESEKIMLGVVGSSLEIIKDRQAILFAASVKQAEQACEIFNRHRANMAVFICGKTEKEDRRNIIRSFSEGAVQLLCNVGVATEGFDVPNVSVIIMGRPTKSRSLYAQCAGRALRPIPGTVDPFDLSEDRRLAIASSRKPSALIVDFVGNSGRHKLMSTADILGGKSSDEAIEMAIAKAKNSGGPVKIAEMLEESEEEIQEAKAQEAARRAKLTAKVSYRTQTINPFDAFDLPVVKDRGWNQGKTLSAAQMALLQKQGIDPLSMSYAEGKQVLNELFRRWDSRLCTLKQAALLKRFGYDGSQMTMNDAKRLIDKIANNGWRRPT